MTSITSILKNNFKGWDVNFESNYPPSDRNSIRRWGWYITFRNPVNGSVAEFRLHDAKYTYGTNFPHEYMVEVVYFPHGYRNEKINYREVVYGDSIEDVFEKALDAWRSKIPREGRTANTSIQSNLLDFAHVLIPLSFIVLVARSNR